ncbi:L-rhamnose isomerase [Dictyoglomus thermophilum]|uniref:L-rhamnose isomerase n=1 Tax=Dictyoglomus thermophilum (strain ATCC 35947 / DSM 3960 / H-6-12) TaxID=309799 RepID=B5YC87_DICT6|nr:L-rhamnose isomerase [Dictyoglomus thermophilum]ACI19345.1 L-rhamnose isomerase [Dictyoglomus thermophilum H-6-12]
MKDYEKRYEILRKMLEEEGIEVDEVEKKLKSFKVETPSWGYGNSGTRFYVFKQKGAARNVKEKLQDAAMVHKLTGICPTVALHIPWDMYDDWDELLRYAESLGVRPGAINPNLFQDDDYKFGSLTHPDKRVREKAIKHILDCIEIAKKLGSRDISLWLADGTNHPGQDDFRLRKHRLEESLKEVYSHLEPNMRLLIEYKFFEPAFYHTDISDWGTAIILSKKLGDKAYVLVDLGHHPLGTNIEQIVAILLDEGKLGGFHFNNKKYADDDLTTGSINPYELFLIFNELVSAEQDGLKMDIAYMIDESHNLKNKIEEMIQSVENIFRTYAKALIVNRKVLRKYQEEQDIVMAENTLVKAFETDVMPLIYKVREEMGVPLDPLKAFRESGYMEKVIKERG